MSSPSNNEPDQASVVFSSSSFGKFEIELLTEVQNYAELARENSGRVTQTLSELGKSRSLSFIERKAKFKAVGELLSPNNESVPKGLRRARNALLHCYLVTYCKVSDPRGPASAEDLSKVFHDASLRRFAVGDTLDWIGDTPQLHRPESAATL